MSQRSDKNQQMLDTLYLDGANALYLEQMQARYAENPSSVDASWRAYFDQNSDGKDHAIKIAAGPAWKSDHWPIDENGELTSALTGDWGDAPTLAAASAAVSKASPQLSGDEVRPPRAIRLMR